MATVRMAAGSVLGTVTDTANAVSSIVKSVSSGAQMLNVYVEQQLKNQTIRNVLNEVTFVENIIEENAFESTQRREKINAYLDANPRRAEIYAVAHKQLSDALANHNKTENGED